MQELKEQTSTVLNLIRGFSAQLVLIGHAFSSLNLRLPFFDVNKPGGSIQHIGVLVFFVLSGFLIAYTIEKKKAFYSLREYVFDRFTRIYVAYIPALLFVIVIDQVGVLLTNVNYPHEQNYSVVNFIGTLLMLQDFPVITFLCKSDCLESLGTGRPFWSLAVEWWLYLFYGIIFFKLLQGKMNAWLWIIFAFVSVSPLYHFVNGMSHQRTDSMSWFWFVGVVGYYLLKPLMRNKYIAHLLVLLIFMTCYRFSQVIYGYDTAFGLMVGIIIILLIAYFQKSTSLFPKFIKKGSAFIADYSFTLYLIHYPMLIFMLKIFPEKHAFLFFLKYFFISNLVSIIIGYCTEMQYRKVRAFLKIYFI